MRGVTIRGALIIAAAVTAIASCGGGDSGSAVVSEDGLLTLVIPEGVDAELSIVPAPVPADVPADLGGTVFVYDLQPSGVEFAEPPVATFRIPASDVGLSIGTPIAGAILTNDEGGDAEPIAAETMRDGDDIVVTTSLSHFSRVWIFVSHFEYSLTGPDPERHAVDPADRWDTLVQHRDSRGDDPVTNGPGPAVTRPVSVDPVSVIGEAGTGYGWQFECTDASGGVVTDGHGVQVVAGLGETGVNRGIVFFGRLLLGEREVDDYVPIWTALVLKDVECVDESTTAGDDAEDSDTVDDLVVELPPESLPEPSSASGIEVLDYGDSDQARVDAAVADATADLRFSPNGGYILIRSGGPDGEGVTVELRPSGDGGFLVEDNAKNDYDVATNESVKDRDVLTEIGWDGDTLVYTWERTNFDQTGWTVRVRQQFPPGSIEWWAVQEFGPSECSLSIDEISISGDDTVTISGSSDAEVLEVFFGGDQRSTPIPVVNGRFLFTQANVVRNDSGKVVVQIVKGAHLLEITEIK